MVYNAASKASRMVKVNLLPPKERTKKQVIKENIIAIFLLIISLVLISGFSVFLMMYKNGIEAKVKDVESEVEQQKEQNKEYADVEIIVSDLNNNIERIDKIQNKNPKWSDILIFISANTPIDLDLTEIAITDTVQNKSKSSSDSDSESNPIILTIKGLSNTQYPIAKLRKALGTYVGFEYVDFESSSWKAEEIRYEFTLKAKLKK